MKNKTIYWCSILIFSLFFSSCKDAKTEPTPFIPDLTKAEEYFNKGFEKLKYEDCRGALKDFKKATDFNPNFYKAYIYIGSCEHELGNYVSAGQNYSRAIIIQPNSGYAYFLRGLSLYQMPGGANSACYDFSKAAELGHYPARDVIRQFCN
jgi:Tfp pilus assembly protein PilF